MKITSLAFADNIPLPLKYTRSGQNVSPPIEFLNVPGDARSLSLIVEDLDSINHRIHWLVYNIPGKVSHFEEGKIAQGAVDGICHEGAIGYDGPCPPDFKGVHHYAFKLYALDTILEVQGIADANAILALMNGHILQTAELIGVAEGEQHVSESGT